MTPKTNQRTAKTSAFFASALVASCSLGFIGCSRPLLQSPADGGRPWIELRSQHFVVKTDNEEDDARRTVADLENIYSVFEEILYPHYPRPNFIAETVLFQDSEALSELGYPWASGFVTRRTGADLEERATVVGAGALGHRHDGTARDTLQHELSHRFTAFYYRSAPVWFNEGLAELYSTLDIHDGRITVGKRAPGARFTLEDWGPTRVAGRYFFPFVPAGKAPSIAQLRSYSATQYYREAAVTSRRPSARTWSAEPP